jgi:hypothetical protein
VCKKVQVNRKLLSGLFVPMGKATGKPYHDLKQRLIWSAYICSHGLIYALRLYKKRGDMMEKEAFVLQEYLDTTLSQFVVEHQRIVKMLQNNEWKNIEEYNILLTALSGVTTSLAQIEQQNMIAQARKEQLEKAKKEAEEAKNE